MAEPLTTNRFGPCPAPAASIHPKLAERLEAGERVIAAGRTSGPDLTTVEMVLLGIATLALGLPIQDYTR